MNEYEFTLRFVLSSTGLVSDDLVEGLGEAGCDDALIGVGRPGRIALEFDRSSPSARAAILGAIRDVRVALPDALLVEVAPDLVGLTDVAEMVGCSRQNVRKLLATSGTAIPAPVHEGSPSLWHLAPVLHWLVIEKHYTVSNELLEVSEAAMRVNTALSALRADGDTQRELQALLV